eukprot:CAMPEP_0177615024 /NCGR_PEP_ID=MMETSP0419_2-20121207/23131_1 /TAXON_ID=582737 /ORGANISM="Tetraselmis sp., Strain GSL018" /LENGTH=80 /DNA_ID=CAMNT_0019112447 /DNA_START=17 /DNA_END=256 /DNA_ORIENTATION=-
MSKARRAKSRRTARAPEESSGEGKNWNEGGGALAPDPQEVVRDIGERIDGGRVGGLKSEFWGDGDSSDTWKAEIRQSGSF